jgi:hypothetical protein
MGASAHLNLAWPSPLSGPTPPDLFQPAPHHQEFFWEDLLEYIDERRVIPVVGAELSVMPDGSADGVSLRRVLAEKLAERLRVTGADFTAPEPLHEVVCRHLERGGRREDVYPRIRNLLKEIAPPIPEPLRQLAGIRHFSLFVSTTFDSLLAQALDAERHGGASTTRSLAFAPNSEVDLPEDFSREAVPATVFHLLGRASASPDYVITEEDTLEFFTRLQNEATRPHVLIDELKASHLLLIGNTFPDWLSRFFIRIAKNGRLSLQRGELEVVADRHSSQDRNLVQFLRMFSYRTQIFQEGNAVHFVRELAERYAQRHPETVPVPPANPPAADVAAGATVTPPAPEMRPGSIFLSYAREDAVAVRRICEALTNAGIDVWFDQRQLEGGDDFDQQIKKSIRSCSLFLPVISTTTQQRHEGYFRLEWTLAVERAKLIAESVPFILPIAIDAVPESEALVPDRFLQVHWTRLPGGAATPEFVERMVRLIREYRKREKGRG